MFGGSLCSVTVFTCLLSLALSHYKPCHARDLDLHDHLCAPSSCGNIPNISYPFRLKGDPQHCGNNKYELSCENNRTLLYLYAGKYYVHSINYINYTIRVVDSGLQPDNFSSLPFHSLAKFNFSSTDPYSTYKVDYTDLSKSIIFMRCAKAVNSSLYVDLAPCIVDHSGRSYFYALVGHHNLFEVEESCTIELMSMTSLPESNHDKNNTVSYIDIHMQLVYGFELSWIRVLCSCASLDLCYFDKNQQTQCHRLWLWSNIPVLDKLYNCLIVVAVYGGMILGARFFLCGVPCFVTLLIYKWRRRHLSMFDSVEDFLRCHNNLMPIRYAYTDIKRMTKGFKDKLGEGGYGSVYKAQLRSGRVVAIKVLANAKANGQDFINEVATIGRIHHVNVVNLIGYCAERSKRALVYEFMPNGSLEKYIFEKHENFPLSGKKMYEISLGVARGIEYLHRGCDIQILHFDIKPHNILLDDNFTPKISDFGLAKIYPTEKGDVTLTAARGTMGYMAPELFYNNIGRVSYKADVYSFGMLLMEMVGRRKNLNAFVEHTSQIYFPSWIYDQLIEENEMKSIVMDIDFDQEEMKMVKKMIIVALWCIQTNPDDRPSMNKVVEMLEGEAESLEMPPKNPVDDARINSNQATASPMVADNDSTDILLV